MSPVGRMSSRNMSPVGRMSSRAMSPVSMTSQKSNKSVVTSQLQDDKEDQLVLVRTFYFLYVKTKYDKKILETKH